MEEAHSYMPDAIELTCDNSLAYAEMRLILARVILEYDITLAEGTEGWDKRGRSYTLWEKDDVNVYLTPRKVE